MKLSILLFMVSINTSILYDFSKNSAPNDWRVVDDVVMGGQSNGRFSINNDGHGVFEGMVSLENNGGFSSVQYQFEKTEVTKNSQIHIRLKGDGKEYQFRIKDKRNNYYSYITTFATSGEWQTVEVKLSDLYPSFRGRKLNLPNFNADSIEEIVFLIANGKNESFKLLLDKIELK